MNVPLDTHASVAYRRDIDGLRAVAVLVVIAFHAFPARMPGGFIGVDVFFVISGFLITSILIKDLHANRFSVATFYARRVKRIFPALLVVLASCAAFGWYALLPDEFSQLGTHTAAGTAFLANVVLSGKSNYFDNVAETMPLLHLWSLGIEEQFYIVWSLMLWAIWRSSRSVRVSMGVAASASVSQHLQSLGGLGCIQQDVVIELLHQQALAADRVEQLQQLRSQQPLRRNRRTPDASIEAIEVARHVGQDRGVGEPEELSAEGRTA